MLHLEYESLLPAGAIVCLLALVIWILQPCEQTKPHVPKNPTRIDLNSCRERWTANQPPPTGETYLVIGAGFLGSRIVEALLHRGETNVSVFDFDSKVKWATDDRVKFIQGDIRDSTQVVNACDGMQTVYMTAASIRFMDKLAFQWKRSYDVNVLGVQNVIDACVAHGVRYLVHTSSFMVNVPKTHDNSFRLKEDMPYVTHENSTSHYATSKAMGESLVRGSNGKNGLHTICLRPTGIFGCTDSLILEIMLRQNMYVFLGLDFLLDFVYVDNVVHAHLLGEKALRERCAQVGGEAFYVTNEEPIRNNGFRRMICYHGKIKTIIHGAPRLFQLMAYIIQLWTMILRHQMPRLGDLEYLTPCAIALMKMDLEVDPTKAQKLLHYHPVFTVEESVQLGTLEFQQKQTIFS